MLGARLGGKCAVYAGTSKLAAARRAVKEADPDVILIDDGFQHLGLHRDIDVVVLDHEHPLGLGGLLPSGTLREFPRTLGKADFLWVNRSGREASKSFTKRKIAAWNWQAPFIFSQPVPARPKNISGDRPDAAFTDVLAFCGIARPGDFRSTLEKAGYNVLELVTFPDHYRYVEDDIRELSDRSKRLGAHCMMTTEKDAMKIPVALSALHGIFMLPIDLEVDGDIDMLLGRIVDCYKDKRAARDEQTM
jgi:tetraacyldisaccharide 4'-kinase